MISTPGESKTTLENLLLGSGVVSDAEGELDTVLRSTLWLSATQDNVQRACGQAGPQYGQGPPEGFG